MQQKLQQIIKRYERLEQNRPFLGAKLVVDSLMAYFFASLAIDSGSYWHYLLSLVFAGLFVRTLAVLKKTYDNK